MGQSDSQVSFSLAYSKASIYLTSLLYPWYLFTLTPLHTCGYGGLSPWKGQGTCLQDLHSSCDTFSYMVGLQSKQGTKCTAYGHTRNMLWRGTWYVREWFRPSGESCSFSFLKGMCNKTVSLLRGFYGLHHFR